MHTLTAAEILILICVTIGAITDLRTRMIYNWITFPAALGGFILNVCQAFAAGNMSASGQAALWSAAGCALGLLLVAGPQALRRKQLIAPGDAKLWAAIGACLFPIKMLIAWFYFSLAYAAVGYVLRALAKGDKSVGKTLIPLGPMIAVGTYLGIFLDKPLMHFMGFNWY
ncbi:MAG: prepilin peptidase [Cyanobacteria bacterium REEB67]|nr:prepilin peptidase [Cyanobacteria bacterium REEB67]